MHFYMYTKIISRRAKMVCEYDYVNVILILLTIITNGNMQSAQQEQLRMQSQSNAIIVDNGVQSSHQLGVVPIIRGNNVHFPDSDVRYDAPDDCHIVSTMDINQPEILLTCNLRTVNSEFDTSNFSVIPADNTVGLHIICNNEIMAKSYLEPRSFAHLIRLQDLSIQYCKLAKFNRNILENLSQLRNLTVRTNNILWPSLNFDIEPDAFTHVKNLERLDLSSNNIWSLPDNIFCSLNGLWSLNMSENRLQDVNELGFRNQYKEISNEHLIIDINTNRLNTVCNFDLEILDVSCNHFVLIPAYGFAMLKRLRILHVNNNEISMIADKALHGLKNLQILNLSSNKIVALPSELLIEQLISIQEVYLQNNSISVLSPKLFSNLKQLQTLDLSMNQITSTWIDRSTFIGLIRLVLLNLSHNKLTKLDPEIFTDLYTLQILNLCYNHLEDIAADTFSPMNNLHTLLLSHNKLKYLDAYTLNGLYVLSLLSLDNNVLNGIHSDAFRNCSSLQDLNLNGNQLKTIPLALRNMRLLRTVDLGENMISVLQDNAFQGLNNLYGLRLIGNFLENITANTFKDLPKLQILNLARNRIVIVEPGAFEIIPSIQAIRLDGNDLSEISGLFSNMLSLLWLNISDNRLEHFDYVHIPNTLQWLDLHKNHLSEISNSLNLDSHIRLQTLDASFNQILRISPSSIPNSIELLFLNDNLINIIDPDSFMHKTNLTRVDLYANQITTLDIKSLRILLVKEQNPLPEFYIGGNPFLCDCTIDWLQKINHIQSRQYPRIMDLDTIYCKLLNNRERAFVPLIEAEPKHFLCAYKTHCFAVCHCCEFDACDCEMTCPSNCTCFHDQTWLTNIVECSSAGYVQIPRKVPMDTTELYIDGNNIIELAGHTFLGRKNLAVLFINNSNVQYIYNTTFSGLKRLMILHLEDNLITIVHGNEFTNLENLRELYLQNNRISSVSNGSFQDLRKLEVLRLDGNRLVYFEVWQLALNPYLVEIGLSNNQWSCECSYLMHFRNYLAQNSDKILDASHVSCVYNNATSILREKNGTKCTLGEDMATYVHASKIGNLLPSLLIGTCAFIAFFTLIMGLFCYRHELTIWAHTTCLINLCYRTHRFGENLDKTRFYDAYFAYSLQDDNFVNQILVNTLENEIGFRLCLHYRDVSINTCISGAIIETAENAKYFVIVLSKNFLYNEWTQFEYKTAIHEIINRNKRIVFILYGELPQRDIDMDMRHYLRTSTCIEWNDKKFWQKLRIALPHIRSKRTTNCLTTRSAVSIYATSHEYQSTAGHISDKHYNDCNNYATINNCTRGYAQISTATSNCKFNTLNELSHKNQGTDYKKISNSGAKTLEHKRHHNLHEYSVPLYLNTATAHMAGVSVPIYDSVDYTQQLTLQQSIPNDCDCTGSSKHSGLKNIHASFSSNFAPLPSLNSNINNIRSNDDSVDSEFLKYSNCQKPCNCSETESTMLQPPSIEHTADSVHNFCECSNDTSNRPSSRSSASTSSSMNNSNDTTSRQPGLTNYDSNLSLNDVNSLDTITHSNAEASTNVASTTKNLWS